MVHLDRHGVPHRLASAGLREMSGGIAAFLALTLVGTFETARAQDALLPGQAFVTQFSGTTTTTVADGVARTVIDVTGASGVAIDLRAPGFAPDGRHWIAEPHRFEASAGDVGQVFGVAIDDAATPNIYLTATALFGLHRNPDNSGWMDGMWGRDGSPGTVYRLPAANSYRVEAFAEITLDGRPNGGAALGNIAFDRWNRQLYVSDLETGMIHRIALADGTDLGRFDHGVFGRRNFFDAVTGRAAALAPVAFDPASSARVLDCPTGDFSRTTSCWNMADFRRRVFGLGVRRDATTGEVRLYYSVWSSQGFGNPAWLTAGTDQKNTLWSVAIDTVGNFDLASVRREATLPDFFVAPEDIARAGYSHPVVDIAFPTFGDQSVMLLAERGGVRNLGFSAENAFASPHEARVLRYQIDAQGVWQPVGRYDVGFTDREDQGPPYIRANAAGGVAFGFGYDAGGAIDPKTPDAFVWMTGDGLCSPAGRCFNPATGAHDDGSEVHGIEGRDLSAFELIVPDAAFRPYPAPGPATPATGPNSAFMIDNNVNIDPAGGVIAVELSRNDATRIGDIAIFQVVRDLTERPVAGPWYGPWEEPWPWPVPEGDYPPLPPPPPGDAWPELALQKSAPAECSPAELCIVTITVTNNGPGTYTGPVHVLDTPDGGILVAASAGWTCEQPAHSGPIGCRSEPMTLAPGASTTLTLTMVWAVIAIADEPVLEYDNCAFIVWPEALDGAARIRAVEAALLLLGYGPGPVDGILDPATETAIDAYRAANGLAPGGLDDALTRVLFPDSTAMPGDGYPDNDRDCARIRVPLPALPEPPVPPEGEPLDIELQLEKEPIGACSTVLRRCDFRVTITNLGTDAYTGPIVVNDAAGLIHGDPIDPGAIGAEDPDWSDAPAAGLTQIVHGPLTIEPGPGHAIHSTIGVTYPAAAAGRTLRNCAFMAWSQFVGWSNIAGGHDAVPANDFACVEVVIPGEGEPPVEPVSENFDLEIAKSAPAQCFAGTACEFTVTITNHGDGVFEGTLPIHEYAGAVGEADDSHLIDREDLVPAEALSVLSAGWTCDAAASELECGDEGVRLEPGDTVDMRVSIVVPADFPDDRVLRNCAQLREVSGEEGPEPNIACASVGIARPENIDLAITKSVLEGQTCHPGARCAFVVDIDNLGTDDFIGTIVFDDVASLGGFPGPATAIYTTSEWDCTELGASANVRRCSWTGTIPHGDRRPAILLVNEPDTITHGELENCAEIAWGAMDFPGGRDGNAANDGHTCATAEILADGVPDAGPASESNDIDLRLEKRAPGTCVRGEVCEFTVTVFNDGPGSYVGPLVVDDDLPHYAPPDTVAAPLPPSWRCAWVAVHDWCVHQPLPHESAALERFSSIPLIIGWTVPANQPLGEIENCASIRWPRRGGFGGLEEPVVIAMMLAAAGFAVDDYPTYADAIRAYREREGLPADANLLDVLSSGTASLEGDAYDGNDRDCVTVEIVEAEADLGPGGATTCRRGESCTLDVWIENFGSKQFEGSAGLRGALSPAVAITSVTGRTPGFDCRVTGAGTYECVGTRLSIKPRDAARIALIVEIPADFPGDEIIHTKDMVWPDEAAKDRYPQNDQDVTTITIEGPIAPQQVAAPDLAISKIAGQGSCVAGQACPFTVTVTNVGAGPFVGPIVLTDTITPADVILSALGPTPWSCRKSGSTTACSRPTITLAPRASLSLALTFTPQRSGASGIDNCAELSWTDAIRIATVQHALNHLGFPAGSIDGKMGPQTRGAIEAFEAGAGLPVTGQLTPELMRSLFGTWAIGDANAANDRACTRVALETPPAPSITCAGGNVRNGECVCPQGTERRQTATNAYQCVAQFVPQIVPQLTCQGGNVRNGECVCPPGTVRRQTATNAYQCVAQFVPPIVPQIVPQLTCQGGSVQNGQCVCPSGTERKQVLPGVFRCEQVAPPIQCSGGTVKNNKCVCPQGMEPRRVSDRVYRCVKTGTPPPTTPSVTPSTPSITCTGGNVRNGQCVCPSGTQRQQTGTNSWKCNPVVLRPLQRIVPKLFQQLQ